MLVINPISDLFTRIRNAIRVKQTSIVVPYSKFKINVLEVLSTEGYIKSYNVIDKKVKKFIKVNIKYVNNTSVIQEIKHVSKPGSRYYIPSSKIPKFKNGFGICIISTSKGVMSGKQARINNVGGEFLGVVS